MGMINTGSLAPEIKLCEAAEVGHGDRTTTSKVKAILGSQQPFIRMDGQGKMCVVGSGVAEAVIRVPPEGYREKIWDHAAGSHFVTEAGGRVSDLDNFQLDFTRGRLLSKEVTGIVTSNGHIHNNVLSCITEARRWNPGE